MFPQRYNSRWTRRTEKSLDQNLKSREDRLLSIVRGLEIELADSYTPKEVDELVKNLKQERERELDQLKKELEETKS